MNMAASKEVREIEGDSDIQNHGQSACFIT